MSSSSIRGLMVAGVCTALLIPETARAQTATPGSLVPTWGVNGPVSMLDIDGSTLYVGGQFDYVGPETGGFGIAGATGSGAVNTAAGVLEGAAAIVADGSGGWFLLTGAPGASLQSILHVLATGQRDPSWAPPVVTGGGSGLALSGGRLYVWGFVTAVNGTPRAGIAALDAATGAVLPWDAQIVHASPGALGVIEAAFDGGRAYIGGFFTSVGGQARRWLAVLDAATGAVLPLTLPDDPGPGLVAIAVSNGRVYVSAFFFGGLTVRAYDLDLVPLAGWAPVTTFGEVLATPGAVFHATWSGDSTVVRAVDPSTGQALPFAPVVLRRHQDAAEVRTLAFAHGRLYIGGWFELVNGQPRSHVVAVDAVTGVPATWGPAVGAPVWAMAADHANVALGGQFRSIGGVARRNLVALDLATGRPTSPGPPDMPFTVKAVLRLGDIVVVGGDALFTTTAPGVNLVAYSRSTGALLPWGLAADSTISALATNGRELFIGGSFNALSGTPRARLASVDLQTAALTSWNPGVEGTVARLQVSGNILYALGYFGRVQGEPRFNIAAFDTMSRSVLPFNPAPGQHSDMAIDGDRLLLAGAYFPSGGGVSAFRWVDRISGADLPLTTTVARPGRRLAAADGTIYATTAFLSGVEHPPIFAIDAASGASVAFVPDVITNDAFAASAEYIAVGLADSTFANGLAVYRTPRPGAPRSLTASVSASTVTLGWQPGLPPAATSFSVEVGTSQGGTEVGVFPVGTATRVSGGLPAGTYFTRVRPLRGNESGSASSEVVVTVPAPSTPPGAPGALSASTGNGVVSLAWGAAAGNATTYVIEAGTAPGLANIGAFATGHLDTSFATPAPSGTYYVRVRAANAFGVGPASNEVAVVVP